MDGRKRYINMGSRMKVGYIRMGMDGSLEGKDNEDRKG